MNTKEIIENKQAEFDKEMAFILKYRVKIPPLLVNKISFYSYLINGIWFEPLKDIAHLQKSLRGSGDRKITYYRMEGDKKLHIEYQLTIKGEHIPLSFYFDVGNPEEALKVIAGDKCRIETKVIKCRETTHKSIVCDLKKEK
jgi:hypothetical protein